MLSVFAFQRADLLVEDDEFVLKSMQPFSQRLDVVIQRWMRLLRGILRGAAFYLYVRLVKGLTLRRLGQQGCLLVCYRVLALYAV